MKYTMGLQWMNEFMALDLKCQKRRVSIHQGKKKEE
jgi:hypothetical protein